MTPNVTRFWEWLCHIIKRNKQYWLKWSENTGNTTFKTVHVWFVEEYVIVSWTDNTVISILIRKVEMIIISNHLWIVKLLSNLLRGSHSIRMKVAKGWVTYQFSNAMYPNKARGGGRGRLFLRKFWKKKRSYRVSKFKSCHLIQNSFPCPATAHLWRWSISCDSNRQVI